MDELRKTVRTLLPLFVVVAGGLIVFVVLKGSMFDVLKYAKDWNNYIVLGSLGLVFLALLLQWRSITAALIFWPLAALGLFAAVLGDKPDLLDRIFALVEGTSRTTTVFGKVHVENEPAKGVPVAFVNLEVVNRLERVPADKDGFFKIDIDTKLFDDNALLWADAANYETSTPMPFKSYARPLRLSLKLLQPYKRESNTSAVKFDGLGWKYDIFWCQERRDAAREVAQNVQRLLVAQDNIVVGLKNWPLNGTVDFRAKLGYFIHSNFFINVTEEKVAQARELKSFLEANKVIPGNIELISAGSFFPRYLSLVVCPNFYR